MIVFIVIKLAFALHLLNLPQLNANENIDIDEVFQTYSLPDLPKYKLRVKENINLCDSVPQLTGYLDISEGKQSYFWWIFESRHNASTDPLTLWLNGGPGCSSFTGLLMELGPCKVDKRGKDTISNPFSWNSRSSMIFLDQPIGTGFSYGSDKIKSSKEAADGVYAFLRILFTAYPKYSALSFHVAGESYAGHYIPEIAKVIIEKSQQTHTKDRVNLKSILIGNGIVDALVQNKYYADMAEDPKYGPILPGNEIKRMRKNYPKCKKLVEKCYKEEDRRICKRSAQFCAQANFLAFDWLTDLSVYDIRKKSEYYDKYDERIESFLNQKHIQKQLGVSRPFAGCSDKVFDRFDKFGDESRPIVWDIPTILDAGIRVLIYAGDADYICNWIGNKAWTMQLDWSGSKRFRNAEDKIWRSETAQKDGGELRTYENLSFLRIYEAGHFVPFDQPKVSLDFFNDFIMDRLN